MQHVLRGLFLSGVLLVGSTRLHAQIEVFDIVPQDRSSETINDSEPNLAVDPANPLRIAASAFTPDSMGTSAPIYVSTDGGSHWTLKRILPGNDPAQGTHDVTLRFGGTSGPRAAAPSKLAQDLVCT